MNLSIIRVDYQIGIPDLSHFQAVVDINNLFAG